MTSGSTWRMGVWMTATTHQPPTWQTKCQQRQRKETQNSGAESFDNQGIPNSFFYKPRQTRFSPALKGKSIQLFAFRFLHPCKTVYSKTEEMFSGGFRISGGIFTTNPNTNISLWPNPASVSLEGHGPRSTFLFSPALRSRIFTNAPLKRKTFRR